MGPAITLVNRTSLESSLLTNWSTEKKKKKKVLKSGSIDFSSNKQPHPLEKQANKPTNKQTSAYIYQRFKIVLSQSGF